MNSYFILYNSFGICFYATLFQSVFTHYKTRRQESRLDFTFPGVPTSKINYPNAGSLIASSGSQYGQQASSSGSRYGKQSSGGGPYGQQTPSSGSQYGQQASSGSQHGHPGPSSSGQYRQQASSGSQYGQQASSGSQYGQQASSGSQYGQQASSDSQYGQQASSGSQYGQQASSGSQYGQQASSGSQYGQPASSGSQHGHPGPSSGSQYGQQASSGSQYGQQASSGSQYGQQGSSGSQYGQQASSGSQHGHPGPSSGSQYGQQASSGSQYGQQASSGSQYGQQASSGSQYGQQASSGSQHGHPGPSSGSQYGQQPSSGSQYGQQASSGSQYGQQASSGSQYGQQASSGSQHGHSGPSSGSQYGQQASSGSQYGQQASSGSQYGQQASSGSQYGQQASSSSQYGQKPSTYGNTAPVLSSELSDCFWSYKSTGLSWASPFERRANMTVNECAQFCLDVPPSETFPCKSFIYEDRLMLCDIYAVTGMDPAASITPTIHSTYYERNPHKCAEAGTVTTTTSSPSISTAISSTSTTSIPVISNSCPPGQTVLMVRAKGEELVGSDGLITEGVSEIDCVQACRTDKAPNGSDYPCLSIDYNASTQTCIQTTEAAAPTRAGVFSPNANSVYYEKLCVPESSANACPGGILERFPEQILLGFDQQVFTADSLSECIDFCLMSPTTCKSPNLPTENCLLNVENEVTEPNLLVPQEGQSVEFVSLSSCDTGLFSVLRKDRNKKTRKKVGFVPDSVRRRFVKPALRKSTKPILKDHFKLLVKPLQINNVIPKQNNGVQSYRKFLTYNKLRRGLIPQDIINTQIPRITNKKRTEPRRYSSRGILEFSRAAFKPIHRLTLEEEHDPSRSYREQLLSKFGSNKQ